MAETPTKLMSAPGIKRDGTVLEGDHYIDGQWVRFQRGRPRKIAGYRTINNDVPEIARGIHSFNINGLTYIHIGTASQLIQYQVSSDGNVVGVFDRTPAGFVSDPNHLWQFDVFTDVAGSGNNYLIAHAGKNLTDIGNSDTATIFSGLVDVTTVLNTVATASLTDVSGGIVAVGVFLFSFGSDGLFFRTGENDLGTNDNEGNVTPQKIIKGFPLRGAGGGPSALFWSLDSLIRVTFGVDNLGATLFNFDTLNSEISVMSSQSIIENHGIYYWLGVDQFYMFNGVVREIPNQLNQNFFFDNINFAHRQKVFAFKVPRFGEIWWCYPRGNATECTHAIILNVRENTWYDTELPDGGRSIGIYAKVHRRPIMFGVDADVTTGFFSMWEHERGVDRVDGQDVQPIQSFFETAEMSMVANPQQPREGSLRVARVEPDFVQSGNMTLTVKGRQNSRASVVSSDPQTFAAIATTPTEETLTFREVRRLMSFKFESNVRGGDYEMGEPLAHITTADKRIES